MAETVTWRGTPAESRELLAALDANCTCEVARSSGVRLRTCTGHALLLDQTALDHLLYGRRLAACWWRQEFAAPDPREGNG